MKLASARIAAGSSRDPICAMDVDETRAAAAGRKPEYNGKTYFFCSCAVAMVLEEELECGLRILRGCLLPVSLHRVTTRGYDRERPQGAEDQGEPPEERSTAWFQILFHHSSQGSAAAR